MFLQNIKSEIVLGILVTVIAVMSFNKPAGGTVRGTVSPTEAGLKAFLFSGKDTVSVNVVSGAFQFLNVAAGNYKLLVEAVPPYRNGVKEGINVADGGFTDAGEMALQK